MTITINGVDYAFNITGTVGLVYLAQRILGKEQFDGNNHYHQIVLYYSAFHASNSTKKNIPDLQTFMASLTTKTMTDMGQYFWKRWNELEGITSQQDNESTSQQDNESTSQRDNESTSQQDDKPGED